MCFFRMGIFRLVLLLSLFFGLWVLVYWIFWRFIGFLENGERVNLSNVKDNNKILIICYNLLVSILI